jgi:hypothetical protein
MREPPRALSVGNPAFRRFEELRESRCRALRTRAAWRQCRSGRASGGHRSQPEI